MQNESRILMFWRNAMGVMLFHSGPELMKGLSLKVGIHGQQIPHTVMECYDAAEALALIETFWTMWGPAFTEAELAETRKGIAQVKDAMPDVRACLLRMDVGHRKPKPGLPAKESRN